MAVGNRSKREYDDYNRLETGQNHYSDFRCSYSHIPKERWEEIFGPKNKKKSAANAPGGLIGNT